MTRVRGTRARAASPTSAEYRALSADDEMAAADAAERAMTAKLRVASTLAPLVGLSFGVASNLVGNGIAGVLRTRQAAADFTPDGDDDGLASGPISNSPTAACTSACSYLRSACTMVREQLDDDKSGPLSSNAEALLGRLVTEARTRWLAHLQRQRFSAAGALRLAADVNAWTTTVRGAFAGVEDTAAAREAVASFSGLASLTSLLMVGDDAVASLLEDDALWAEHGVEVG